MINDLSEVFQQILIECLWLLVTVLRVLARAQIEGGNHTNNYIDAYIITNCDNC
jgi:hypothetical protein